MAARFFLRSELCKAQGPFIGPKGGKWADAEHTIPWKEPVGNAPSGAPIVPAAKLSTGTEDKEFWNRRAEHHEREIQAIKKRLKERHGGVVDEYLGMASKQKNKMLLDIERNVVAMWAARAGRAPTKQEIDEAVAKRTKKWSDQSKFEQGLIKSEAFQKSSGPFIGPRGGKWADAEHTIAWKEETPGTAHGGYHPHQWSALGEHFQKVGEASDKPQVKARNHARAEMAHYYAGGGKDPAEAEKLYHYRMAKQGQPKDEVDAEQLSDHLKWNMEKLHAQAQGSVPEKAEGTGDQFSPGMSLEQVKAHMEKLPVGAKVQWQHPASQYPVTWIKVSNQFGGAWTGAGSPDPKPASQLAPSFQAHLGPTGKGKLVVYPDGKLPEGPSKPDFQKKTISAPTAPSTSGQPTFPGESLAPGDHIIVGKHKFQVVEAPVHDPYKSKVIGNNYFKLKVKKPGGSKVFDAQVHDAGGKPFWNVTDKGKQVVGMYSGGNEGHQKVSAETKAPKHEAVKQEAIGKANEHDIDAVPTGLSSAWHKRWSYGTQPEPVSGSLNKMVANYLLRHHEKGMSAEDHMAAAKFHEQYGADVMSGKKLPSLPHKTARSHRQQLHEALADFHEKMATQPDFVEKVYAIAGKKPKVKKSLSGIDGIGEYLENSRFADLVLEKAGGPFIGPRGGKWADAAHTIPWQEETTAYKPGPLEQKVAQLMQNPPALTTYKEVMDSVKVDNLRLDLRREITQNPGVHFNHQSRVLSGAPENTTKLWNQFNRYADQVHEKVTGKKPWAGPALGDWGGGEDDAGNQPVGTWARSLSGLGSIENYLAKAGAGKEKSDMTQNSLEKGFLPPAAPAAGNGAAVGGSYTRRWKGPAGKWLYEYDDPAHRAAIDASNTAETHPGTAGDLIGAHQGAAQAHLKAAQSLNHDPQASAEHAQVAADHAKAAAVVHANYFLEKDKAQAAGATPPPAPGVNDSRPGVPPQPGQQLGAISLKPAVPGQPPVQPGQPVAQPGAVPPKPGVPPQPGQAPAAPGAAGAGSSLPQPPPDMKTVPSTPGGGQSPVGPPQAKGKPMPPPAAPGQPPAKGKPTVAIGPKGGKMSKFQKSLDGIDALSEYLEKAQGMPEGGPKEKLGTGEEQGGKVDGIGQVSGENDSPSKPAGAPSVPQKKLSEDDEEDEGQMKPHKKPIETAKSMAVPGHQREMVAREHAAEVARLQKSDDVVVGLGVGREHPAAQPAPRSILWKQGKDGFVTYSNQADLEVERLTKSGEFYVGDAPQISRVSPLVAQQVRCPSCQSLMAKSLAVCPECGEGAQRAIPRVISDGESAPKPEYNRPGLLRPARHRGDVFFPGK